MNELDVLNIKPSKETEKAGGESKEKYEELCTIFKALGKVKDQLGEQMWQRIRKLLVEGHMKTQEAAFLQGLRRDTAAQYLGMNREDYEKSLSPQGRF